MNEEARAARLIERLAFPRASASAAEARAAQIVAAELVAAGAGGVRLELEHVHGTHWWPYGLPAAVALCGGLLLERRRRPVIGRLVAALGLAGAVSVLEDTSGGPRLLRRVLPQRPSLNVAGVLGDVDAPLTLIVSSHHDSAHGGIGFEEPLASLFARGRTRDTFAQIAGGPALVGAGALLGSRRLRRAGIALAALTSGLLADIGHRPAVPGAGDNAAGCAALVLLARRLASSPPVGVRVLLVSTGSEESWLEGMSAFLDRHRAQLPVERTVLLCLDSINFTTLSLRDREDSPLGAHRTPSWLADAVRDSAARAGVELASGFPGAFPTDALAAHLRGYAAATLVSFEDGGRMPGYHTDRDTPDRVHLPSVVAAAAVAEALARGLTTAGGH